MKDETVRIKSKTYKPLQDTKYGEEVRHLKDGSILKIPNIKRITVTDYEDIVIIEGKLFVEVKKKC